METCCTFPVRNRLRRRDSGLAAPVRWKKNVDHGRNQSGQYFGGSAANVAGHGCHRLDSDGLPETPDAAGSISQVRESTGRLLRFAKDNNIR